MRNRICRILCIVFITTLLLTSCAAPYDWPDTLTDAQIQNLAKLCKVWGFVKYYHPAVVNGGEADWDQALLDSFPDVLESQDTATLNALLSDWVSALGPVELVVDAPSTAPEIPPAVGRWVSPLLGWIEDEAYLGGELSRQLLELKQIRIEDRNMPFDRIDIGHDLFYWEKRYKLMSFSNVRLRLLGLFRYWNAFAYYSPYTDILDEDWDAVLSRLIPVMLSGKDKQSYALCLSELTAATQDGHAMIFSSNVMLKHLGKYLPPVLFTQVDEQIVILKVSPEYEADCPLQPGDIVLALDGVNISDVIKKQIQYISVPYPNKVTGNLQYSLFRTKNPSMQFRILRDQEKLELDVPCLSQYSGDKLPSHEWVSNGVGLINPGFLNENELTSVLEEFRLAAGIVVDLRQYPAAGAGMFDMALFTFAQKEICALFSFPDYGAPGEFVIFLEEKGEENPNYYHGKLVILIDQTSASQPEFVTMILRQSSSAIVMGENSMGADGDMVNIPLPGNIQATFSGLGVFTPEGGQTQRIGVAPDIYVPRTIEGIREGRDELLEAAIAYINAE